VKNGRISGHFYVRLLPAPLPQALQQKNEMLYRLIGKCPHRFEPKCAILRRFVSEIFSFPGLLFAANVYAKNPVHLTKISSPRLACRRHGVYFYTFLD
jgi:hypothetical protein